MKVLILYRPHSEHATEVEMFVRDFEQQHHLDEGKLELVSVDTRDGSATAALYDIWSFPTIMVVADGDRRLVKLWQGKPLPLMNEVAGYLNS